MQNWKVYGKKNQQRITRWQEVCACIRIRMFWLHPTWHPEWYPAPAEVHPAEAPLTPALPEEATEEHPESSDGQKQSTANMKKEKDESYIFSRFVFFCLKLLWFFRHAQKYLHMNKHFACMIIRHLQMDYWERCKRKNNRETQRAFDSNAGKG